jgi:hypothetical protein
MLVVIAILVVVAVVLMNGQKNQNIVVNNVSNTVENTVPEVVTADFNFTTGYSLKYDVSLFNIDDTAENTLDYGDITIKYDEAYTAESLNADLKNEEHRKALVTAIYSAIEPQITSAGGVPSQPVTSFTQSSTSADNKDYYYAIDRTTPSSISRFYFIVSDDYKYLFQFTVSSSSVSSFTRDEEADITNTLVGIYATTSTPSLTDPNSVTNSVDNNVVDNTLTNTTTNAVDNTLTNTTTNTTENTTNSIMNVLETNTTENTLVPNTNTTTNTSNLSPLPVVQQ